MTNLALLFAGEEMEEERSFSLLVRVTLGPAGAPRLPQTSHQQPALPAALLVGGSGSKKRAHSWHTALKRSSKELTRLSGKHSVTLSSSNIQTTLKSRRTERL